MKLNFKKKSLIFFISICCSLYSLNVLDPDFYLNTLIDLRPLNYTHSDEYGSISSSTVAHENHATVTYTFHNYETGEIGEGTFTLNYDIFSNVNSASSFDCELPIYDELPQFSTTNSDTIDYFESHLKDSALEQRRQDMQENHTNLIQEQKTFSLRDISNYQDLEKILSIPEVRSFFQQLMYSFIYQLQEETCFSKRKDVLTEIQAKMDFVGALLSGKTVNLLKQINHGDLAIKENAVNELRQLWPWDHKHTFLNHKSYNSDEQKFLNKIQHLNILKIAEIDLTSSPDYIAKYAQGKSLQTIQSHQEKCLSLQKQGKYHELNNELRQLLKSVRKRGGKDFTTNTCLAITQKIVLDPITTTLHTVVRAPSLQEARTALENLEKSIARQIKEKNITLTAETRKMLIEQYGYDILDAAHTCYKSRADYVHTAENQTTFSDPIHDILSSIKYKNLHIAHAELMHLQKQISDAFAERNITDPIEQKELIIKSFNSDVISDAFTAYKERPDFFNLTKLFVRIDVPTKTAEILSNSTSYESVFNDFQIITDQVLDNAKLCQVQFPPEVEDQLIQSLHVIREPKNNAEFIFHASIADHLLTDIQCQSQAIATATPTVWQKTSEAFLHGMWTFLSRLNPITQATDVASLVIDRFAAIVKDPIGETQKSIATTLNIIDFISTFGRLTSDSAYGLHYLSTQEGQQRIGRYCENIVILGHVIDKSAENITAKDVSGTVGHILGDIFSAKVISTAATFLRQIDALGKISQEAKVIAQGIKTIVEEHPAYAAAEGTVLKMSNGMKNTGNAIKESAVAKNAIQKVANMKEFFELPFGKTLYPHSLKTKHPYQGVPIYQLIEDVPESNLKKGFYYYLDKLHRDHIEVFNKRGNAVAVYNLDGTFNSKKFDAAQKAGRNIKEII